MTQTGKNSDSMPVLLNCCIIRVQSETTVFICRREKKIRTMGLYSVVLCSYHLVVEEKLL